PVRGVLAKRFRQELGINLIAWNLAKFKGKSGFAAQTEEAKGRAKKINNAESKTTNNAVTENLNEGVEATRELEEAAADSDKEAQAALKNGGVVQTAQEAATASVKKSGLDTVTGYVNPAAGIGMAACIVYDGSLKNSGSTIDQQTTQAVAS